MQSEGSSVGQIHQDNFGATLESWLLPWEGSVLSTIRPNFKVAVLPNMLSVSFQTSRPAWVQHSWYDNAWYPDQQVGENKIGNRLLLDSAEDRPTDSKVNSLVHNGGQGVYRYCSEPRHSNHFGSLHHRNDRRSSRWINPRCRIRGTVTCKWGLVLWW